MRQVKHWRYHYKGERGCYWATLFLDERGAFAYVSDAGNGAYGHFYCNDIRHFVAYDLADAPKYPDYLAGKLCRGQRTEFNHDRTLQNAKEHIIYYRKDNAITKEMARGLWDNLPEEEYKEAWVQYFNEDYWEFWGSDWYENIAYDWDGWTIGFIEKCLPGLQELIRKELEEEARLKELSVL